MRAGVDYRAVEVDLVEVAQTRSARPDARTERGELLAQIKENRFNAPMTGAVAVYQGETGTLSNRAFLTDQDGIIWRIDLTDSTANILISDGELAALRSRIRPGRASLRYFDQVDFDGPIVDSRAHERG